MNIEKLIAAAQEIDRLAALKEARVEEWRQLAHDARQSDTDQRDIQRRKRELDAMQVVDLGNAVSALRAALRAKEQS